MATKTIDTFLEPRDEADEIELDLETLDRVTGGIRKVGVADDGV